MTSFVVLTGDDKRDILQPDVIGPFPDDGAAEAWVASLPNAIVDDESSPWPGAVILMPTGYDGGGYAGYAIVSEATAADPVEYLSDVVEVFGEDFPDGQVPA